MMLRRAVPASLVGLAFAALAAGQGMDAPPVDQAVGDLDPLSRSFRRVEPGLRQFDRTTALRPTGSDGWRRINDVPIEPLTGLPMPHAYVYTAPGVRAYMPRPDYLVRDADDGRSIDMNMAPARDGEYRLLPPANTVYDLVYRAPLLRERELDPDALDRRLDTRIDLRLPPVTSRTGNADFGDEPVMVRSPQQMLLDHYNRTQGGAARDGDAPPLPTAENHRSPADARIVDEPDAPQPRRDERDDAVRE